MKRLLIFLTAIIVNFSYAQEAALNKVAEKVCDYLKSDEYKALEKNQKTVKMGLKMLELYGSYRDEFNEDAILNFDEKSGRELGEKIGIRMASICPNELMEMAAGYVADESEDENEEETESDKDLNTEDVYIGTIEGKVNEIENEPVSYILVKDNFGNIHNVLITEKVDNIEMINKSITKKNVIVNFTNQKFYDIDQKNYVYKKVLTSITLK